MAAEISTQQRAFAGDISWGDDTHAGASLGIAYAPSPQWDAELTVASQTHISPYTRVFYAPLPGGAPGSVYPSTEFHEYRVNPVDLSVTRHFLTGQRITPYVRAGVRYVKGPNDPSPDNVGTPIYRGPDDLPFVQVSEGYGLDDRLSVQAGAGMRLRLTSRTAVRAEATRLIRTDKSDFDPLLRYAVGLSWMF
ncbi:MAG TPA: hypothetical protein VGD79_00425 [Thermoanaerobaculia bacterium]